MTWAAAYPLTALPVVDHACPGEDFVPTIRNAVPVYAKREKTSAADLVLCDIDLTFIWQFKSRFFTTE